MEFLLPLDHVQRMGEQQKKRTNKKRKEPKAPSVGLMTVTREIVRVIFDLFGALMNTRSLTPTLSVIVEERGCECE